jgi:hypothetical protein
MSMLVTIVCSVSGLNLMVSELFLYHRIGWISDVLSFLGLPDTPHSAKEPATPSKRTKKPTLKKAAAIASAVCTRYAILLIFGISTLIRVQLV